MTTQSKSVSTEESEVITREIYKATAKFIRGRVVRGAKEEIQVISDKVSSASLTEKHAKLCALRIAEATERQGL